MDFVRNPIDRVISWYYYVRQSWFPLNWDDKIAFDNDKIKLDEHRTWKPSRYKMTFEDCILADDSACSYPIGSLVSFRDGEKSFWGQVRKFLIM